MKKTLITLITFMFMIIGASKIAFADFNAPMNTLGYEVTAQSTLYNFDAIESLGTGDYQAWWESAGANKDREVTFISGTFGTGYNTSARLMRNGTGKTTIAYNVAADMNVENSGRLVLDFSMYTIGGGFVDLRCTDDNNNEFTARIAVFYPANVKKEWSIPAQNDGTSANNECYENACNYETGKWYDARYIIDTGLDKYDLYLKESGEKDYTLCAKGKSFFKDNDYSTATSIANVKCISFSTGNGGEQNGFAFDNVQVKLLTPTQQIEQLRQKWIEFLIDTQSDKSDGDVREYLDELNSQAKTSRDTANIESSDYLWYVDSKNAGTSGILTNHYGRILKMALAYKTPGQSMYKNQKLKPVILNALSFMYTKYYNENTVYDAQYENWWDFEIGVPRSLTQILMLMKDDIPDEDMEKYESAILHFDPGVREDLTGANRMWIAKILMFLGMATDNSDLCTYGMDEMRPLFCYSQAGDGFYRDGSVIFHTNNPYTMGYGLSQLTDMADVMYLLAGTEFDFDNSMKQIVYDWVYDSFVPMMYNGFAMDLTLGRNISNQSIDFLRIGHDFAEAVTILCESADDANAQLLRQTAKKYLKYYEGKDIFADTDYLSAIRLQQNILADDSIEESADGVYTKHFAAMEQTVAHRNGYSLGISTISKRKCQYESIWGQNVDGFYTHAGAIYLYNYDTMKYRSNLWLTTDMYHIPGTTVDQHIAYDTEGADRTATNDVSGGVVLNDMYSVSAMDYKQYNRSLTAKKSYFIFDDELVCLGANINSWHEDAVHTTIDNRQLNVNGDNAVSFNEETTVEKLPTSFVTRANLKNTSWMHIKGSSRADDVGYFFPGGETIKVIRSNRVASSDKTTIPCSQNYIKAWIDHGKKPVNESYAYVMLPGKDKAQTENYSKNPNVEILVNDKNVQAVREKVQNVTGITFWNAGTQDIIEAKNPMTVIYGISNNRIEIAVSDPSHSLDTLALCVKADGYSLDSSESDAGVSGQTSSGVVNLTVDTSDKTGESFRAVLVK